MVPRQPRGRPDGGQFAPRPSGEAEHVELEEPLAGADRPELTAVLKSAARLQQLVPEAVLVGGSAAALWAGHRDSYDHDHVLSDLTERFDAVLEAIEATDGWITNQVAPGKIILGELGGIETGVRQLIRRRPLEVVEVEVEPDQRLQVPTPEETLRIKAYLVVRRNQTRDYLDVAALADHLGVPRAGAVLAGMDDYYGDQRPPEVEGVATQVARQLADPQPADSKTPRQLSAYKGLSPKWADWSAVTCVCRQVAAAMVREAPR